MSIAIASTKPSGEMEEAIEQIWRELLKVDRVGRHDNFFELGGHSLLAVTVIETMRQSGLRTDALAIFTASSRRRVRVKGRANKGGRAGDVVYVGSDAGQIRIPVR